LLVSPVWIMFSHWVPALLFWTVAGGVVASLPNSVSRVLLFLYTGVMGLAEVASPRAAIQVSWQVPSSCVSGPPARRAAVSGVTLGPGVMTKNPYAGMWTIPLALAGLSGFAHAALAGAIAGSAHGIARGLGVVGESRHLGEQGRVDSLLESGKTWRTYDGVLLLFAFGFLGRFL
jgi:hypothetical protein